MNRAALAEVFGPIDDSVSEGDLIAAFLALPIAQQDALAAAAARASFAEFVRQAWHVIDPHPLVHSWHLDAICLHLQAMTAGEILRLIINIAPRHGKSNLFSIMWPAWIWIHNPEAQFFYLSYAAALSVEHSIKCRQLISSSWYRDSFGIDWQLRDDQNVKSDFVNTVGGRRRATSITGSIVGRGGDYICIDDPLNAEEAYSKAAREQANRVISEVVSTRLNDQKTGRVALIMQRLHEDDPTGHLLQGGRYEHLCLPSEYERDRRAVTHRVVQGARVELWRDPRTVEGEPLFPDKFSAADLEALKQPDALGASAYASQHQQRPAPAGGNIIDPKWFKFWRKEGDPEAQSRPAGCRPDAARMLPDKFGQAVISVDANFRATEGADPVAIQVWAEHGADRFLLYRSHGPFGFAKSVTEIRRVHGVIQNDFKIRIRKILIEARANGDAIIETLKSELLGVIGVEPYGGKEARAWGVQPQIEAGNIYLPDGAPWLDGFVTECAVFPKGRHDDDVDAMSQALIDLAHGPETTMQKWARVAM